MILRVTQVFEPLKQSIAEGSNHLLSAEAVSEYRI